ncbi:hypothetical protein M8494_11705 [Serratia ureilytica]
MIELCRLRAVRHRCVKKRHHPRRRAAVYPAAPLTLLGAGEWWATLLPLRGARAPSVGVLFRRRPAPCWRAPNARARCSAPRAASRGTRHRLQFRRAAPVRAQPAAPLPRHPAGITTQLEEAGSGELMEALLEQRLDAPSRSPANGIPHERGAGAARADDRRPAAGPPAGA